MVSFVTEDTEIFLRLASAPETHILRGGGVSTWSWPTTASLDEMEADVQYVPGGSTAGPLFCLFLFLHL